MKVTKLYFSFFILLFTGSFSFGQSWAWGQEGKVTINNGSCEGWNMAEDPLHNAILTGFFADTIQIGSVSLATYNNEDLYLIKYDPSGNLVWAKQAVLPSANCSEWYSNIAVDLNGNNYITGFYYDSLIFDTYTVVTTVNYPGIYLVKYDINGNAIWAVSPPKTGNLNSRDEALAITVDTKSNPYISGYFNYNLVFGPDTLQTNYSEMFIAKYGNIGNAIWAEQPAYMSSSGSSGGMSLTTDSKNNIYLTGYFSDTLLLGSSLLANSATDIFLAKFDTSGNFIWAKQANCNYPSKSNAITTDKNGNIYMVGSFTDSITFSSTILQSGSYNTDLFIARFDSLGNIIWGDAGVLLDNNNWNAYTIATDTLGHIYISCGGFGDGSSGSFEIMFGTDTFSTYENNSDGVSLVLELDTNGQFMCGNIVAGGGDDQNAITSDHSSNYVYFGGDLWTTVIFGPDTLPFEGGEAPFIARWQPCNNIETSINPIIEKSSVSLFPNPNNGVFTIQWSVRMYPFGINSVQSSVLEIYNVLGEKVFTETLRSAQGDNTINLIGQPNGMYLYRIVDENGELIGEGKFIIE